MNVYDFMPNSGKYLEIGPLDKPHLRRPEYDVYYMDYHTTEEVKELYKGTYADLDKIVDIDYPVGTKSYKEAVGNIKFAGVFSSHCIEHTYDIIGHFKEVSSILEEGGRYVLILPDMSNCFDCFRSPSSFREAYSVFIGGKKNSFVADAVMNEVYRCESNDVKDFWGKKISFIPRLLCESSAQINMIKEIYKGDESLKDFPAGHIWTFTYDGLLELLRDCIRFELLPFVVEAHESNLNENSYNIYLVLRKNSNVLVQKEMKLKEILKLQMFLEKRRGIHNLLVDALFKKRDKLYIYGIGKIGRCLYNSLKSCEDINYEIDFLVSDDKRPDKDDLPAPLHMVSEIKSVSNPMIIIATTNIKYANEMEQNLKTMGFQSDIHYFRLLR